MVALRDIKSSLLTRSIQTELVDVREKELTVQDSFSSSPLVGNKFFIILVKTSIFILACLVALAFHLSNLLFHACYVCLAYIILIRILRRTYRFSFHYAIMFPCSVLLVVCSTNFGTAVIRERDSNSTIKVKKYKNKRLLSFIRAVSSARRSAVV